MNKQLIEEYADKTVQLVQNRPNGLCDMGKYNLVFARLIVDKCISLISHKDEWSDAIALIKNHFGLSMTRERNFLITTLKERSDALVISLVGKDLAPEWWQSKNYAFDGKTPEAMFIEDPEAVYYYLMDYANK